ncbi:hypothetical protein BCR33DRAFT_770684 [Rhizoclosmatium globosum]|uniref:UspA domain-containing protein n=1 Tax=Rhizoclosmatium globosum TaxID=329046 RepID=A0A1Y2BKC8_9FUNG|nr:hypothetical protein BCR33DRAFT_770684 [Rhizoclosmatium globosum]|eukprot:ORY35228.1 hypothetical protein BCR33DRAFT_770684 [Rhizoclosmatium globosum]
MFPEPTRHILVAIDGTQESLEALTWTQTHLIDPNSTTTQITLLHVHEGYSPPAQNQYASFARQHAEQERRHSASLLKHAVSHLPTTLNVNTVSKPGDPRTVIVDTAKEMQRIHGNVTVVVGRRAKGKKGYFEGSVSDLSLER